MTYLTNNPHECIEKAMSACNACGYCCGTDQEGEVLIFPHDAARIFQFLDISLEKFIETHCILIEYEYDPFKYRKGADFNDEIPGDCKQGPIYFFPNKDIRSLPSPIYLPIFSLQVNTAMGCTLYQPMNRTCRVYSARPEQCRAFPFIYCILDDPLQVDQLRQHCQVMKKAVDLLSQPFSNQEICTITATEQNTEFQYYTKLFGKGGALYGKSRQKKWDDTPLEAQRRILVDEYQRILEG